MPTSLPPQLAEIIATHRGLFGGFQMMADEPPVDPAPKVDPPKPAESPKPAEPKTAPDDKTDWKAEAERAKAELDKTVADRDKWQNLSRKHERRQLEALGFDADAVERIIAEQKANPKAVAEKVAGYDELVKRIEGLEKTATDATARAAVAEAVSTYHVSAEDAPLLAGLSGDALINLAKRLGQEPKSPPAAPSLDGAGKVGAPVSGPKQIATREEYAALSPEERRAARKDGRLNQLLGITS
jgi:hypothetical protein